MGVAVGGTLADYTEFDRKNYFYPDLPKGYQISQYEYPLVKGGRLCGVEITRIHLEEDTANSKHTGSHSVVDFNRAGIPLMELVTEPVVHDAKTAAAFAKELQLLLRTIGAGEANMEKGQMRVEANISVSQDSSLGTKTEVKNLNSFRSVERAIEFEIKRQIGVLESGGTLVQETRGFDETTGETFSQRKKESSHDYRYFPEPDIPKLKLSLVEQFSAKEISEHLPELPNTRRTRYVQAGLKEADAEILVSEPLFSAFADEVILRQGGGKVVQLALNYLITDVRGRGVTDEELKNASNGSFMKLMQMAESDQLSSSATKTILNSVLKNGTDPEILAKEQGLLQIVDSTALESIVDGVINDNQKAALEYQQGKEASIQFLIGQAMKKSKGAAKPAVLKEIIHNKLQAK
jgi:aspartyl-tRNA(Asn)/glutamyl-tRNA(Gln) amidotransferase subunit B